MYGVQKVLVNYLDKRKKKKIRGVFLMPFKLFFFWNFTLNVVLNWWIGSRHPTRHSTSKNAKHTTKGKGFKDEEKKTFYSAGRDWSCKIFLRLKV